MLPHKAGAKETKRQFYNKIWKVQKQIPPALIQPELPEEFAYLWEWFWEIFHPEGILFTEIEAWARIRNVRLLPHELRILKRLDNLYQSEKNKYVDSISTTRSSPARGSGKNSKGNFQR
jgi:hypothetical protein